VSWCVPKRVPKAGKHGGEVPETVEYALLARSTGMAATAKRFSLRLAVCAPARVTRLPGSESSACVAGSHSPWPPPLAPPAPRAGCPALFVGFPAVESGEVGLAPSLRPLTQTARAVFPQAAFLCGRHCGVEGGLSSSADRRLQDILDAGAGSDSCQRRAARPASGRRTPRLLIGVCRQLVAVRPK
jgi:hypothetical protein